MSEAATLEKPAPPVEAPKPAKVGDAVWLVFQETGGPLRVLPGHLYEPAPDNTWNVNAFRLGYMLPVRMAAYCGAEWVNGGWCWPGEGPKG